MNTTGIIVGRLSTEEMEKIILECEDKQIRYKFMHLLKYSWKLKDELVISEFLK